VDAFVIVSSAGEPLTVALAGLTQDITLTSARRAAATTYTRITSQVSLDSTVGRGQNSTEARMQAIQNEKPDIILLVGGVDDGAESPVIEMVNMIAMALQIVPEARNPSIIFAGNKATQPQVTDILQPVARLTLVDNVRPTLDTENLAPVQLELEKLYSHYRMSRLAGFEKLQNWSPTAITPASRSFEKFIAFLGQHHRSNVIGMDVGSRSTVVATQARDHQNTTIRTDAGVGHSLAALLNRVPVERIRRWLPFEVEPDELHNRLLNRSLHPGGLPTTHEQLHLDHAIAREALRLVVEQAQSSWRSDTSSGRYAIQWRMMIGAGRILTHVPQPGYAAQTMLDGLEPWGVTQLLLDTNGVTNVLGALAAVEPVAAVEVATNKETLLKLGTVIAPLGHGPANSTALHLTIRESSEISTEFEISYGSILVIPLPPDKKVTLEMRPSRYFDIGLGQPGRGAVAEVSGGVLGLIVDARGRPLRLPTDDGIRQEKLAKWLTALGVS
ncbi:MAG: glutamate mutase L, partial [Anaerolineae bacterium]|nr:glutamate mutase L [Anaerolineae bacterium]